MEITIDSISSKLRILLLAKVKEQHYAEELYIAIHEASIETPNTIINAKRIG
jgi:hypothetical protein